MKNRGDVFDKKQTLTGTKAFPQSGEAFSSEILNRPAYHLALVSTTRPAMCRWFRSSPLMTIS